MRVPLSWLAEFVDIEDLSGEEIADALTMRSAETTLEVFKPPVEKALSVKVISVSPHPNNPSLAVAEVSTGKENFRVITGDLSLREKDIVLLAPEGSLVGGKRIERREIGGILSEGVLIAPEDLGFEEKSEGVLRLDPDTPAGVDVSELLGYGEEILELDITPNRGDLLSVRGVAREVSALFRRAKKEHAPPQFPQTGDLEIHIGDRDCLRYRGIAIEGISNKTSPLNIRKRLWQCNLRPINAVVDITNYIMLQEGQPLHAFDMKEIKTPIYVRSAGEGETIKTLDGKEHRLSPDILLIADSQGPIAVAGVIGGMDSSVDEDTDSILLESAFFRPSRVRRSSGSLGVRTESSYRFERSIDIEGVGRAQDIAAGMILEICGGKVVAVSDLYEERYSPKRVFVSWGKLQRYAGREIAPEEVSTILSSLGIECTTKACGIEAEIPSHRAFDMSRDVDIIEEIMRVKGYEQFPPKTLHIASRPSSPVEKEEKVRDLLASRGFSEVINIPFEEEDTYRLLGIESPQAQLLNPLLPTQRFLRSMLLPGLLRTASFNDSHYNHDIAIFEIGRVFDRECEKLKLGVLAKGVREHLPKEEWSERDILDSFMAIGTMLGKELTLEESGIGFLHPGIQTSVILDGEEIGFIGRLNPQIEKQLGLKGKTYVGEIYLEKLLTEERKIYKKLSKYPPAHRDIALIVDKNLSVSKLLNEIRSHIGERIEEVMVFDIYAGDKVGEGKKSVGIRLALRSAEGSLSGEEVSEIVEDLVQTLQDRLGAKLR